MATFDQPQGLDLSPVLHQVDVPEGTPLHSTVAQDHGLDEKLDVQLLELCAPALTGGELVRADLTVRNVDRTVGTILGHHVTKATDGAGLPENTIDLTFTATHNPWADPREGVSWRCVSVPG